MVNQIWRGELSDTERIYSPDILLFQNNEWIVAEESYHHDLPTAGTRLAASFVPALNKKYKKQIGFIPCAFGGTSISQWQPGEDLYENAVKATLEAQKSSVLKGILWHQGENDSCLTFEHALRYKEAFLSFYTPLLQAVNAKGLPFIIGELGSFLENSDGLYWKEINKAMHQIADSTSQIEIIPSNNLCGLNDHIHFDTPSLRELGRRYASAWESIAPRLKISLE